LKWILTGDLPVSQNQMQYGIPTIHTRKSVIYQNHCLLLRTSSNMMAEQLKGDETIEI